MKNTPLISVLLPTYNCELYIKEAVDSILNQTYSNFEFLIIDDCSTDNTISILKEYQDSRIKLILKPKNTGYTNSLNYGISIANGKYIARMDGDDISLPTRFEKQVKFLENNPDVVLCGTQYKIIGKNKIVTVPENHEDIKYELLQNSAFGHPTVMMRKSALDQLPFVYNAEREPAEDYDLWTRLLLIGNLYNLQEVLLQYRIHDSQVSSKRNEKQALVAVNIKYDLLKHIDYIFSEKEEILYKNCAATAFRPNFSEFQDYLELLSNLKAIKFDHIFEKQRFLKFINTSESRIVNKYFVNRLYFNPNIYMQYLKIKGNLGQQLSRKVELKLLVKSLIWHKIK